MHKPTHRRAVLLQGLALGWAAALPAGRAAAAVPLDGAWTDGTRQRSLPWRLRLPDTPGPWPLIVHSHGLGGSREGGAAWGQAWVRAGLAVLHLQHPGSDVDTLRRGLRALRQAASGEQLAARVADLRFVLDEVVRRAQAEGGPWAQLRADAIGVSGHSFGAHTTLALAGQRFVGSSAPFTDLRPRAFIAFSPSAPAHGGQGLQQAFGAITRPVLLVTGSDDGDPLGGAATGATRASVYDGLPPGRRGLLWLHGADHMSFGGGRPVGAGQRSLGRQGGEARTLDAAHHAVVASVTSAWWRAQLLDDAAARAVLAQPDGLGPQDRLQLG